MEADDSVMAVERCRGEIDTSSPIESVKDAANMFGGIGYWKPQNNLKPCLEAGFEEQAMELEKLMFEKERETLEVLHELEKTKSLVAELKSRIKSETSEQNNVGKESSKAVGDEQENDEIRGCVGIGIPTSAPGFVLLELKRAKTSLVKTANDIECLRAAVESYVLRIESERKALEMTRKCLTSNTSLASCLEKELHDANEKLTFAKEVCADHAVKNAESLSKQLEILNAETSDFKKIKEAAKCEMVKAMSDIETTKNQLHVVETSLIAAEKIKEAARASESIAIVELKALNNVNQALSNEVTLSAAEYSLLKSKAREAEEKCRVKIEDAKFELDDAKLSKMEILRRVEEATEEAKATKMALEEALKRCEVANKGKLDLDKAIRHRIKRCRCARKSAKFKNASQNGRKKVTSLNDLQINLKSEWSDPATRPTLSIGQILSQKLLHPNPTEQDENAPEKLPNENTVHDVSLREMLRIDKGGNVSKSIRAKRDNIDEQHCAKRKTFGLGRIGVLLSKQSKKKKSIPSFKHCTGKAYPHHDRLSFG